MKKLMMILALVTGVAAGVRPARAQAGQRMAEARNAMGLAIPAAQVYVCTQTATVALTATPPCSPEATVYSDPAMTHAITQPVLTNGNGAYVYYATAGTVVTEVLTGAQINAQSQTVVVGGGGGAAFVYTGVLSGIPATCTVGQTAFITNATAGQNQYNCTATNIWTQNLNSETPASPGAAIQFANAGATALATASSGGTAAGVDNVSSPSVLFLPFSQAIKGIAPSADIKMFGANPRQGAPQTTTATTVSGSPTITLTSAIDFKPNEYVVLPAGNVNPNAAPGAPTSVASPTVSGTNTITYTLVGRVDSPGAGIGPGGLTPVSAGASTTTSPAIFGPSPVTITSATASAGSVTVNATGINCTTSTHIHVVGLSGTGAGWNGYFLPTTGGTNSCIYSVSGATGTATTTGATVVLTNAAIPTSITRSSAGVISITTDIAHNYVATASPNQTFLILEGSSTPDCNGQYLIATASGTSITTVATGLTPASTETCGLTAGTTHVQVWEKNVVTVPAYANGITQYYVYDNNPAATVQPIGETAPGVLTFTDYGPVVTNQFVPPPYVPSTPPVADTNSLWVGQIQSGAGTTTLTMTTNVPTTQSSPVLAEHDDGQAILAACDTMSQSGTAGGGEVLISAPNTYNFGRYIVNYPLTLPKDCGLTLATRVIENETLTLGLGSPLQSSNAPTYSGTPAQGGGSYAVISGIANPIVETQNGQLDGNLIRGINFTAGSSEQTMLLIESQSSNVKDSVFQANFMCYSTDIVYQGQSGGVQQLRHNTYNTSCSGIPPTGGYLPEAPAIWIRADAASGGVPGQFNSDGANQWAGGGVMVDARLRTANPVLQFHFLGINEDQEPTTPFLYVYGGNISGDADWQVGGVVMDSQGEGCFGSFAAAVTNVWLMGCDVSASQGNLVTGNAISGLTVANPVTTGHIGSTAYNLIDSTGMTAPQVTTPILNWPDGPAVAGQIPVVQNNAPVVAASPGLPDSVNSPVSTTPYTIACDTSSALVDRVHLLRFASGAAAVTVPLSTASGCGGGFTTKALDVNAGTLTFTATSPDTFTVLNGSTTSSAVTSFTLTNGQYASLAQGAAGIWEITIAAGGGGGAGPNFTTPISVAPPSGATVSALIQPDNTAGLMLQRNIGTSTSSSTTVACPYRNNVTAASLLYIAVQWPSSTATASIADTLASTWTAVGAGVIVQGGQSSESWYSPNAAAGADTVTITFTAAQGNAMVTCREYQGVATSSPLDVQISGHGSGTTISSGSMTTTNANDLLVAYISPQVVAPVTQTGGYNERQQSWISGFGGIFDSDQLVTATGGYTNSATIPANFSTGWVAQEVAFKLTAAPATAPMLSAQNANTFSFDSVNFLGNHYFHKLISDSPTSITLGAINIGSEQDICWGASCFYLNYGVMHSPFPVTLDNSNAFSAGPITASSSYSLTHILASATAPTIASGFGTTPTIPNANGTAAFTVNVGTGGTATSGVLTMPAAADGWACSAIDSTTTSATVFITKAVGTSTTSVTVSSYSDTGVASAWAASDILQVRCTAY